MGATPNSYEKKQYFTIHGFNFTQRTEPNATGAVMRTYENRAKEVKTVWEREFKEISGIIKSLEFKETDFGTQYHLTINDVAEDFIIQIPTESGYADALCAKLPNIHPSVEVKVTAYSFIPDGKTKKKEGINIHQNGVKIMPAFTKDNPNGMPQADDISDKDEWKIFFMQLRKFYKKTAAAFNDKLKGGAAAPASHGFYGPPVAPAFTPDTDSDDLPF